MTIWQSQKDQLEPGAPFPSSGSASNRNDHAAGVAVHTAVPSPDTGPVPDVPAPLTNISLFAGVGGLDLGSHLVGGFRTVAYVEYDRYAQGVLMSRMRSGDLDDAPIFEDVRTFDGRSLEGRIGVVSGGFPCQDVSHAGKRAGLKDGTRSGLWSEFARIIREVKPRFVLVENVGGLLSIDDGRGFGIVLGDLAAMGFDAEWFVLSAADVGAPHRRERVWVVAWDRVRYPPQWPTPSAGKITRSGDLVNADGTPWDGQQKPHSAKTGKPVQTALTDAVDARGQWPTPTRRDGKDKDAPNRGGGAKPL